MSNLLKRRRKLSEPEIRYYIIQLISSLKYLHENLVIHRDLKLGNLFIDSQMRIKVGDFGLAAKLTDVGERRKTFCGTPNYIGEYCTRHVHKTRTFYFYFVGLVLGLGVLVIGLYSN
jgi:serine/threonine protein kinase